MKPAEFVKRSRLVLAVVTGIALSYAPQGRADDAKEDADEIKLLVPAATAMSLADFDTLATSSSPKASGVESKSLTLMLLSLAPGGDENAQEAFRYLGGNPPKPTKLAGEISRLIKGRGRLRVALGPATMVHSDRITDCTCDVDGDKATGTVSFEVPDLYAGKVDYVARRTDGKWQITEFKMPAYEVHVVRGKEGNWNEAKAEGAAP